MITSTDASVVDTSIVWAVTIDHKHFPHIVDSILLHPASWIPFRATSNEYRRRIDVLLHRHLIISDMEWEPGPTCKEEGEDSRIIVYSPHGRLPSFKPRISYLAGHIVPVTLPNKRTGAPSAARSTALPSCCAIRKFSTCVISSTLKVGSSRRADSWTWFAFSPNSRRLVNLLPGSAPTAQPRSTFKPTRLYWCPSSTIPCVPIVLSGTGMLLKSRYQPEHARWFRISRSERTETRSGARIPHTHRHGQSSNLCRGNRLLPSMGIHFGRYSCRKYQYQLELTPLSIPTMASSQESC